MGVVRRASFSVTTGLMVGLALPAVAEEAARYTFTVLRDGDPIGEHSFAFHESGGRIEIEATTDLEVKFAMIPVFQFEHQRREVWENGRPVLITSETNNDGDRYEITVRPNGHGLIRTVNGRVDHFDPEVKVLGFWDKSVVNHGSFFSVTEDKVIAASFELVGRETVEVGGTPVPTERYRMRGDVERDIWFDEQGHTVKVEFEKRGSHITYLRDQVAPQALQCAGTSDARAARLC